jgi:hypothetical protein
MPKVMRAGASSHQGLTVARDRFVASLERINADEKVIDIAKSVSTDDAEAPTPDK